MKAQSRITLPSMIDLNIDDFFALANVACKYVFKLSVTVKEEKHLCPFNAWINLCNIYCVSSLSLSFNTLFHHLTFEVPIYLSCHLIRLPNTVARI